MISKLTKDEQTLNSEDPYKMKSKLDLCMDMIGPADDSGKYDQEQSLCARLILDAIFVAHQIRCPQYRMDDALKAISRTTQGIGAVLQYLVDHRPKVDMVGLAAGNQIMPVAFQSQEEANQYRQSLQSTFNALNDSPVLHLIDVELTTSSVNSELQPLREKPLQVKPSKAPTVTAEALASEIDQALKTPKILKEASPDKDIPAFLSRPE